MSDGLTDVERKLIEFATKTAETIQTRAGQSEHLDQRPVDQFSREYFDELARFLEDP